MSGAVLYIVFAIVLGLVIFFLWRYWADLVDRSPEEEAYERRLTALNERQAHRYSDDELTTAPSEDDAWRIMVERGRRAGRQDRYAGDLARRRRERRGRKKQP
ncbi:MAG TPA: hypothetical protein VNL77_05600 [Roseiflexaceae bacterium]|nr:hypothetical protein [Roseiflexaceae bacterium]